MLKKLFCSGNKTCKKYRARGRWRPQLESLESRLAPACTLTGGTVNCDAGNDGIYTNLTDFGVHANNVYLGSWSDYTLTVNGGGGSNSLFVVGCCSDTYTFTTTPSPRIIEVEYIIAYTGINGSLRLDTPYWSGEGVTINVDSTAKGTPVTINGSDGIDTIAVTAGGNLESLGGALTVNGGWGTDNLTLHDQLNGYNDTYTLTSSSLARSYAPTITYNSVAGLAVNAGTGNNLINVSGMSAGATTTINANGGNDTINFTCAGNTTAILNANGGDDTINLANPFLGVLTVNGDGGSDTLNVNDQANPFDRTYTITNTAVSRSGNGGGPISYSTFETLVLNVGSGNEQVSVNGTAAGTATTVNGNIGNDNVAVIFPSLAGALTVYGQGGTDTLTFWDTTNPANDSYTIAAGSVWRSAAQTTMYATVEDLTVHAGTGNNAIYVISTNSGTTTQVNAGSGNDTVALTHSFANLANLGGPLIVNGQAGNDNLSARDEASGSTTKTYSITANSVSRSGAQNVAYNSFETIGLFSSPGADTINVTAHTGDLSGIPDLFIDANLGTDKLQISDHNYPYGDTYFVASFSGPYYSGTMDLPSIGLDIDFKSIETLNLYPSPHPHTVVNTSGYSPAHYALNIIMTPPPFGPGTAPSGGGSGDGNRPAKPRDTQAVWSELTVDDPEVSDLQSTPQSAAKWTRRAAIEPRAIADEMKNRNTHYWNGAIITKAK